MQPDETPKTLTTATLRVGVVYWQQNDGLGTQTCGILENLGHEAINFLYDAKLPQDLDVVFTYGPFGSLVPLANQLLACPPTKRPLFIWWITEQLPNPALPEWILYGGGRLRSRVERLAFRQRTIGEWQLKPRLRWLAAKAHRFRYYGDLHWLRRTGILSILVTGSPWRADFLRVRGFDPFVPPSPNYRPKWGADLKLERDIPVLWLGKIATRRRKRLLHRVRTEMRQRGVEILVVDGIENPYIFGEERTILLNRTKIVLNLLRAKWDNHAGRYALAAQNRALIVTEPSYPHTSFLPEVHFVEAPIERMTDTICHYLENEDERQQIVERAYQFIRKTSREEIFVQLLEQAAIMRRKANFK